MSFDALRWAAQQKLRPSQKLVLWSLADALNRNCTTAWPSVDAICAFTGLNKKTVIKALDELEEMRLISEAGRTGRTRQVKRYRLHLERGPHPEPFQKRNCSGNSCEESQNRNTEPGIGTKNKKAVDNSDHLRIPPRRGSTTGRDGLSIGSIVNGICNLARLNQDGD